jgi:opine dehydrogenase
VSKPNVTILGGGNGAFAYAADLSLKGSKVKIFEAPQFASTLTGVKEQGGIQLDVRGDAGVVPGFATIDLATSDIEEALRGAQIIFMVVPSYAQRIFGEMAAPYLQNGQIIVLSPANFGGAMELAQIIEKAGNPADVIIVETECMMYSGFKDGPTSVWVSGYKHGMKAVAFPANRTNSAMTLIRQVYPEWEVAANVMETGLRNVNTVFHAPIMVLNAGRVEAEGEFLFYWDGVTPSVGRVIEAVEAERMAIGKALQLNLTPNRDVLIEWYGHSGCKGDTLSEAMATNPVYEWDDAPKTLRHRFLLEDIPFGMVPMESLGRIAGVPTPNTTAIIELACALVGEDMRKESRTLEYLGLGQISLQDLLRLVNG